MKVDNIVQSVWKWIKQDKCFSFFFLFPIFKEIFSTHFPDCSRTFSTLYSHFLGLFFLKLFIEVLGKHRSQETALMSPLPVRMYIRKVNVDSVLQSGVWLPQQSGSQETAPNVLHLNPRDSNNPMVISQLWSDIYFNLPNLVVRRKKHVLTSLKKIVFGINISLLRKIGYSTK